MNTRHPSPTVVARLWTEEACFAVLDLDRNRTRRGLAALTLRYRRWRAWGRAVSAQVWRAVQPALRAVGDRLLPVGLAFGAIFLAVNYLLGWMRHDLFPRGLSRRDARTLRAAAANSVGGLFWLLTGPPRLVGRLAGRALAWLTTPRRSRAAGTSPAARRAAAPLPVAIPVLPEAIPVVNLAEALGVGDYPPAEEEAPVYTAVLPAASAPPRSARPPEFPSPARKAVPFPSAARLLTTV
jgi:hypothetical protein